MIGKIKAKGRMDAISSWLHHAAVVQKWNGVADGRNKPAQRCFFLIPKNVTSERHIARLSAMIRWWEGFAGARGDEIAA